MSASPDLNAILQDLAAGKFDAAEAERRIAALSGSIDQTEHGRHAATGTGWAPVDSFTRDDDTGYRTTEPRRCADQSATPDEPVGAVTEEQQPAAPQPAPPGAEAGQSAGASAGSGEPTGAPQPGLDAAAVLGLLRDKVVDPMLQAATNVASNAAQAASRAAATMAKQTADQSVPGVDRLVVRAIGRRVRIIGDPAVASVTVSGPHDMRRNGSAVEVSSDGNLAPSLDGFSIVRPPRSLADLTNLGLGKVLNIRVNPSIVVDAEVTGGGLTMEGVPHLNKIRVTAGGATLRDVVQVEDALVQMGNATLRGPVSQGRSRIRVESGNLTVQLEENSNVVIRTESSLGMISWPVEHGEKLDEYVMGEGAARLDIGVVMGHAGVRVEAVGPEK